ncbi:class I SAM-dependent methyltransferase [Kribbella sp. VKM Ac-2566]|uniref:class I SAM-dependent methyltransferase n=1 Tax=Kribbella sp. VKM Ac-2566 TaxID=2512218 RepID=UPI0010DAFF09|nr:class I SAM-dependent methyltransferase [Kribbella sp. VKM Ac-2566]TDW98241.1 methyltransferase family protein [Kribbella sp. VKM Ac-2566]
MDTPVIPLDRPTVDPAIETHYSSRWDEAARLSSTVKGRLEQARLYDFLGQWFPPAPSRVADIGGGPGVHAGWLRDQGHEVVLLDPVQRHVDQANAAGITAELGDGRRLPWSNQSFDAVLMAGPLYHLPEAHDRRLALREALRVLRPGGVLAAVAINRAANLIGSTLANTLLTRHGIVSDILETGHSADNERMAHCYYHRESELRSELISAGLRPVDIFGLTGPGGWLTVMIDAHFKNQPYTDKLAEHDPLDTALECSRLADRMPELVAASSLFLAIGQKG